MQKRNVKKHRLLIVTQVLDDQDSNLGFFVEWVRAFASEWSAVSVIANRVGSHTLPENVEVLSLGKESGAHRVARELQYLKHLTRVLPRTDSVFIHMCPEYLLGGAWVARLLGKPVGFWYLHKSLSWKLRLSVFLSSVVFTAHADGFPLHSAKLKAVGHGIQIPPESAAHTKSSSDGLNMVTIGRISASKRLDVLIEGLRLWKQAHPEKRATLTIVGSAYLPGDRAYKQDLEKNIDDAGLAQDVTFVGAVPHSEIPSFLKKADVFVSASETGGIDKAALEAMSMALPVVVSSKPLWNVLPASCLFRSGTPEELVERLEQMDKIDGNALRSIVEKNHHLPATIAKISDFLAGKS